VEYRADLRAIHPRVERSRHPGHMWQDARNRVWLAKRNLPCLVAVIYVATWAALTSARNVTHLGELRAWWAGAWQGLRTDAGKRRPISWRTVWTMTRHGRPPII